MRLSLHSRDKRIEELEWRGESERKFSFRALASWGASLNYSAILFLFIFAIPTSVSVVYYGLVASDRYVSESKFIVRGVNGGQIGGLSVLLRTFGISRSNDDTFAIEEYILSRDALNDLSRFVDVTGAYTRDQADFVTRYGTTFGENTFESLYSYFIDQIRVVRDVETGITTLSVSAYEARDAKDIADGLLKLGEARVNEMNARSRKDALASAIESLQAAEANVLSAQTELTRFRNAEFTVDMKKSVSGNLDVITELHKDLATQQVLLQQLEASSPSNPGIHSQAKRVAAIENQLATEKSKIAGSDDAIATKLGDYEGLLLRKGLADSLYESAVTSLDQARDEARRKQIYLEPIVRPNQPDRPSEPRRLRSIFTVALLTFASYLMIYLLVSGSREHLNIH